MIPYGLHDISEEDIQAVAAVLRSELITLGPVVENFEQTIAEYCKAKYGIAVCNATAALHLCCKVLGVAAGDYVWTSPNTFVASANCALYCGAKVDFVDIDPRTYNMCHLKLAAKLEIAAKHNKLPKLVIPVHFAGQCCNMREIKALADKYKFYLVEDASHAIGGSYCQAKIGNCKYSDMTVFSFHPVKIITTGEGGVITTNNEKLAARIKLLRSHGIAREAELMDRPPDGLWYYQQIELGYNYKITDFQSALGLSQFKRLDEFVRRRNELAKCYDAGLANLPLVVPYQNPDSYSAYHLYVIQLELSRLQKKRLQIFNELRAANIGVFVHYIPVHTQPFYKNLGFKEGDFPVAEKYYQQAITIPLFYGLTLEQQQYIIARIKEIVK